MIKHQTNKDKDKDTKQETTNKTLARQTTKMSTTSQEIIDHLAGGQRIDPETDHLTVTQRSDLVFFSQEGMVYRLHTDETGHKVWLILSNKLNAVGWYAVESQFVHTQLHTTLQKTINLFGTCTVNAYPGNSGSIFKMEDITYSTSPVFSFSEYNTVSSTHSGPILENFSNREWIYLYLKDKTNNLIAYTYPLIPWMEGSDSEGPWHAVPNSAAPAPTTGESYHDHTFPNSALVSNLPIFYPTSYGKYPTSYEVNGFNGWCDLTNTSVPSSPEDFDSWQTLGDEIENEIVQSVVDQVLYYSEDDSEDDSEEFEIENEVVQSVVDQVLNDAEDDGLMTPDSPHRAVAQSDSSSCSEWETASETSSVSDGLSMSSSYSDDITVSAHSSDTGSYNTTDSDSSYVPESSSSDSSEEWGYEKDYQWDYEYRCDPFTGSWYTQHDFVAYYGDSTFWDMLSPEKEADRFMIENLLIRNRPLLSDDNVNHLLDALLDTFM
jgi:hypothetical protein